MSYSSESPSPNEQLPLPRSQRLPSFLETNVWGQDDSAVPEIKSTPKELESVIFEVPTKRSSSPVKEKQACWEDPTSAWGNAGNFDSPIVTENSAPTFIEEATKSISSKESPQEKVAHDGFGDFSSFDKGFETFDPEETNDSDFGGFGSFSNDVPEITEPPPDNNRVTINCFEVDFNLEMHSILENLCGNSSEALDIESCFLDSSTPKPSMNHHMSIEVQALKRGLFSPSQVDSKFSWQGSSTETKFFCVNGVSEKAQRRFKSTSTSCVTRHPFDFRPKKTKSSIVIENPSKSLSDVPSLEVISSPSIQDGVILSDFSDPVRTLLQSIPNIGFMFSEKSISMTSKSLFDSETEVAPVVDFEFTQFNGNISPKSKQPVFDLLD